MGFLKNQALLFIYFFGTIINNSQNGSLQATQEYQRTLPHKHTLPQDIQHRGTDPWPLPLQYQREIVFPQNKSQLLSEQPISEFLQWLQSGIFIILAVFNSCPTCLFDPNSMLMDAQLMFNVASPILIQTEKKQNQKRYLRGSRIPGHPGTNFQIRTTKSSPQFHMTCVSSPNPRC